MAEIITFPDTVHALCGFVRTKLDEYGPAVPVGVLVPNPRPSTFVTLQRVGGIRRNLVVDEPSIAVEAWAASEAAAYDLAALVRGIVYSAAGQPVGDVGTIYSVNEVGGLTSLPDPTSAQHRYTFTVAVAVRGAAI